MASSRKGHRSRCRAHLGRGIFFVGVTLFAASVRAEPVRLKDLVHIRGVRDNYLNGLGIVVGLKASGDSKKSLATSKAIATMLTRMGLKTGPDEVVAGNMAAVMVTAVLPPFARLGEKLDVQVATVGDAKSLAGGTLILTPLRAGDSEVYAVAQGPIVVGQASGSGPQVLTVARAPQAASVEREFTPTLAPGGKLTLTLADPDFTTSARIAAAIDRDLGGFFARATDGATIVVEVPPPFRDGLVPFVSRLEALQVDADRRAIVVLNERTGTVVMGADVAIKPVAIAHGALSVRVGNPSGKGSKGGATSQSNVVSLKGSTVGDLTETMNALGVKPADLVGILQAIHAAGALKADLRFL